MGERLFSVLPNTEYKAACVLITPAKVSAAKEFGAKQIIITATLNQKDEMLAKLAGVNGELWLGITDLATILDNGDEVEKIPLGVNRWRCAGGEFVYLMMACGISQTQKTMSQAKKLGFHRLCMWTA
ncbi:hypothetical protein [Moraxella caviae]|uniref:hypothetical protein n=1 Tax=Moraxella caviae TaxID=34060 RepID=UPI00105655AC|nr:hypothetical protein [Moraxella caviae]